MGPLKKINLRGPLVVNVLQTIDRHSTIRQSKKYFQEKSLFRGKRCKMCGVEKRRESEREKKNKKCIEIL